MANAIETIPTELVRSYRSNAKGAVQELKFYAVMGYQGQKTFRV